MRTLVNLGKEADAREFTGKTVNWDDLRQRQNGLYSRIGVAGDRGVEEKDSCESLASVIEDDIVELKGTYSWTHPCRPPWSGHRRETP